jgi:hypothetical protein
MYAKLYSTILRSSIWLEDAETRLLWITMLAAADEKGFVFGSPAGMAHTARISIEATKAALAKLAAPDPDSSDLSENPENEGRRIEVVDGGWRLINYGRYRAIRDSDERREQNRQAKRRERERLISQRQPTSANVSPSEAEAESYSESDKTKSERERFAPPTLDEVREYAKEIPGLNAEAFMDHYESNGWKVGKASMKSWKAAARKWRRKDIEDGKINPSKVDAGDNLKTEREKRAAEMDRAIENVRQVEADRAEYQRLLAADPAAAAEFRAAVIARDK